MSNIHFIYTHTHHASSPPCVILLVTCSWEEKTHNWCGSGAKDAVTDGQGSGWKKTNSNGGDYSCCKANPTKCKAFCDAISSCRAYGVSDGGGCFLWKTPPTMSKHCKANKDHYFGVKTCIGEPCEHHLPQTQR